VDALKLVQKKEARPDALAAGESEEEEREAARRSKVRTGTLVGALLVTQASTEGQTRTIDAAHNRKEFPGLARNQNEQANTRRSHSPSLDC
jgi:hypothetical protein